MKIYEQMWDELKQRLALAEQYSLRPDITVGHVYKLLLALEEFHKDEIEKEVQNQQERAIKDMGLEPINDHSPQDVAEDAE